MKNYDYEYVYKGYKLEYHYLEEEDCIHEGVIVWSPEGEWLTQINWAGCEEKAKKYVDELVEKQETLNAKLKKLEELERYEKELGMPLERFLCLIIYQPKEIIVKLNSLIGTFKKNIVDWRKVELIDVIYEKPYPNHYISVIYEDDLGKTCYSKVFLRDYGKTWAFDYTQFKD